MSDATELDLTTMSDPALLDLRHELHTALATRPDTVEREQYAAIEREVARRISGVLWRTA
jgi:hypothetical protein